MKQQSSGRYIHLQPVPPTVRVFSLGDINKNLGKFTSAILSQPQLTQGKYVLGSVEQLTLGKILEIWSHAAKKPAVYVQVSLDDYDNVWPGWGYEVGVMLQFWEEYKENSWSGEKFLTSEDLGIKGKFAGLRETFERPDWNLSY